jgi:hypothetical protein
MRIPSARRAALAFAVGLSTVLSSGCAVTGGGYGYDEGGYGVGYYEPIGVDYGGWGSGYRVAPNRGGGDRRADGGGGRSAPHAYRSAPASHAMPSLPSSSRGGGRGGGGHR